MIRFVTDEHECKQLWDTFSPHERAWDEWELMAAFHDEAVFRFNFVAHETDGVTDGLIPLVLNTANGRHELFGGSYPDSRVLWIDTQHFPEYFDQLPENTVFFDLRGSWADGLLTMHPQYEPNFVDRDIQYFLVPADFDYDFVNHINTFSNGKRKGFLRDLRRLKEQDVQLIWNDEDESDLLISLSVKNFGDESDHAQEDGKAEVKRVVRELKNLGYLRTLTVIVDGVKQATSLSAHFKKTWVALYAGSNNDIDNLGKLLNSETIQESCRLKVDEINYMTGMAWKAAWHMKENPCRTMRKPAKTMTAES